MIEPLHQKRIISVSVTHMYRFHHKKGSFKTTLLKLKSKDRMKGEYIFVYMTYVIYR